MSVRVSVDSSSVSCRFENGGDIGGEDGGEDGGELIEMVEI